MTNHTIGHNRFTKVEKDSFYSHVTSLNKSLKNLPSSEQKTSIINLLYTLVHRKYNFHLNPGFFQPLLADLSQILGKGFLHLLPHEQLQVLIYLSQIQWPLELTPTMPYQSLIEIYNSSPDLWRNPDYIMVFIEAMIVGNKDESPQNLYNLLDVHISGLISALFIHRQTTNIPRLLECLSTINYKYTGTRSYDAMLLVGIMIFLNMDNNPTHFSRVLSDIARLDMLIRDFPTEEHKIFSEKMFKYATVLRNNYEVFSLAEFGNVIFYLGKMGYVLNSKDLERLQNIFAHIDFSTYSESNWVKLLMGLEFLNVPVAQMPEHFQKQILDFIRYKIDTISSTNIDYILSAVIACGKRIENLDLASQRKLHLHVAKICFNNDESLNYSLFIKIVPILLKFGVMKDLLLTLISPAKIIAPIFIICARDTDHNSLKQLASILDTCSLLGINLHKNETALASIYAHIKRAPESYDPKQQRKFLILLLTSLDKLNILDQGLMIKLIGIGNNFSLEETMQIYRLRLAVEERFPRNKWNDDGLRMLNGIIHKLRDHILVAVVANIKDKNPKIIFENSNQSDIYFPEYNLAVFIERGTKTIARVNLTEYGMKIPVRFHVGGVLETISTITEQILYYMEIRTQILSTKQAAHLQENEAKVEELSIQDNTILDHEPINRGTLPRSDSAPALVYSEVNNATEWHDLVPLERSASAAPILTKIEKLTFGG